MIKIAYEKRLAKAVVKRVVKDVISQDARESELALLFIGSGEFERQCKRAGYPGSLAECTRGLEQLLPVQRQYMVGEILRFMEEVDAPHAVADETVPVLKSRYDEMVKSLEELKTELASARMRVAELERLYESES